MIFTVGDRAEMNDAAHKIGELGLMVEIATRHSDPLGIAHAHRAWLKRNDVQLRVPYPVPCDDCGVGIGEPCRDGCPAQD